MKRFRTSLGASDLFITLRCHFSRYLSRFKIQRLHDSLTVTLSRFGYFLETGFEGLFTLKRFLGIHIALRLPVLRAA